MKTFKLIGKIILGSVLTILYWFLAIYILGELLKFNNNVSGGMAYLGVFYFWGIYFLAQKNYWKILGIISYVLAVLFNLVLIASPYDNNTEYASTRFFTLISLAAAIYLICRKEIASKVFGIILIIITILSFVLGFFFMVGNMPEFQ